jgi:hypothetical protein
MGKRTMYKFIHDILTEPNNNTYCIIKTMAGVGMLSFIGLGITHVIMNHTIDFMGFGTGIAAIMGATGVGTKFKKDTPDAVS